MNDDELVDFLMDQIRVTSASSQVRLLELARHCARTVGHSGAGGNPGDITAPLVGAVPGSVAATLAALSLGTRSRISLNHTEREELRRFASEL